MAVREAVNPAIERDAAVASVVKRVWGFDALRPLQRDAINAALDGADSLTVLPTGGGKSLCYQVPPLVTGKLTLVVSPLIALMKDQVSALKLTGYPAAAAHSHQTDEERAEMRRMIAGGSLRLLLTSPERLLSDGFIPFMKRLNLGVIAIDEAHCISQWGHDFRPEYRRLAELRSHFPGIPINAFTATATPRVQSDIVEQLQLRDARVMIGTFDRPNLTYRVLPRVSEGRQVAEAVKRHPDAAAIVYCISRKDTEALAEDLRARSINAQAYHAGMDPEQRTAVSEDFRAERLDVVVATVAFGMGIDRSDVRLVVHAAMPKSIEGYQQETGRAGRDGLPAECLLLYSASDLMRWKQVMSRGSAENGGSAEVLAHQFSLLNEMQGLISGNTCRHRAISEYFGQSYPKPDCGACDHCLKELEEVAGSHEIAQKILSCVARCGQNFGSKHICDVLLGLPIQRVREKGHDKLSTFGLLAGTDRQMLNSFVDQLIDAGDLTRTEGEYPVLQLTGTSSEILRSQRKAVLVQPKADVGRSDREKKATHAEGPPLAGAERELFDELRKLRRELAEKLGVPPYVVFNDATLEELSRARPSTATAMLNIRGVGNQKLEKFGDVFCEAIRSFCGTRGMSLDVSAGTRPRRTPGEGVANLGRVSDAKKKAMEMFARGTGVEDVARETQRTRGTTMDYLAEFIELNRPEAIDQWVSPDRYIRIRNAVEESGSERLKPVFDALGGEVPYEEIRLVAAHRRATAASGGSRTTA